MLVIERLMKRFEELSKWETVRNLHFGLKTDLCDMTRKHLKALNFLQVCKCHVPVAVAAGFNAIDSPGRDVSSGDI